MDSIKQLLLPTKRLIRIFLHYINGIFLFCFATGLFQIRWQERVVEYEVAMEHVVGDVFIATACVAYLGAFTSKYRELLVTQWIENCQKVSLKQLTKVVGKLIFYLLGQIEKTIISQGCIFR